MLMYIYINIYVYITEPKTLFDVSENSTRRVRICRYRYTHARVDIFTYVCMYIYIYTNIYMHIYIYIYIYLHIYVNIHVCLYI